MICWRLTVKRGIEEEEDVTSAHFESFTVDLKGNTNATVQLSVGNSQTGKVVILGQTGLERKTETKYEGDSDCSTQ